MSTLLITIIPSLLILLYFFLSDKFKEPKETIALVFVLGVLICLPAGIINHFMDENFSNIFSQKLLYSFLGPAWGEEILKFLILYTIVLKRNELKASRTKIVLLWSLDQYEMKGEKHEKLAELETKLKDYIGDVESVQDPSNIFSNDKTLIIVACSESDYQLISKNNKDNDFIVLKANPLCEVSPQK